MININITNMLAIIKLISSIREENTINTVPRECKNIQTNKKNHI